MRFSIALAFLLLCGCAADPFAGGTFVPGKMTSLSDGTVFPMQIELSYGSGRLTATDPVTGEILTGTYTAILETHVIQHQSTSLFGEDETATDTSGIAQGSAVLVGNKGTVVNLKLQIKPGTQPSGFGEAEDNHGKKYNIQF